MRIGKSMRGSGAGSSLVWKRKRKDEAAVKEWPLESQL
jgi:hypothetical protein